MTLYQIPNDLEVKTKYFSQAVTIYEDTFGYACVTPFMTTERIRSTLFFGFFEMLNMILALCNVYLCCNRT
jgi:hypothetical protein